MTYNNKALTDRYEQMTGVATAHAVFRTALVGGLSADEKGIRAYVAHHMKLTGQDAEDAVARIIKEELGERDTTPETGELKEKMVYGVTVFRRDSNGPWLGDWMAKACLKAAASRLNLFMTKRGSKGDIAEMGRVAAIGSSLRDPAKPHQLYLVDADGKPADTYFDEIKGRISGPSGSASIVSQKECAPAGTRISFSFRWYNGKLKEDDIANIFAAAMNIGLGSAKAFERGKFDIERLEIGGAAVVVEGDPVK